MISRPSSWSGTITRRSDIGGLCLILDAERLQVPAEHAAEAALSGGIRFFQYRSKYGSRKAIYEISLNLAGLLKRRGALFIVNDHADIAAAVNADGVHLGQDDLPLEYARKLLGNDKIIGISTHDPEQARTAQASGADYIGYGPIFATATKNAGPQKGLEGIRTARTAVTVPIIAIGGISSENIPDVFRAGADGAAVISAILSASDITSASHDLADRVKRSRVTEH
ncbi:MAG: thiamine phosphate synthase [Nitrospirota bacterium]